MKPHARVRGAVQQLFGLARLQVGEPVGTQAEAAHGKEMAVMNSQVCYLGGR